MEIRNKAIFRTVIVFTKQAKLQQLWEEDRRARGSHHHKRAQRVALVIFCVFCFLTEEENLVRFWTHKLPTSTASWPEQEVIIAATSLTLKSFVVENILVPCQHYIYEEMPTTLTNMFSSEAEGNFASQNHAQVNFENVASKFIDTFFLSIWD